MQSCLLYTSVPSLSDYLQFSVYTVSYTHLDVYKRQVLHFLNSVYTHISPKVYHFYHTCVYARVCEREGYKIPRIKKPTHLSKRWLKYVITVGCLGATLKLRLNFPSENFLKSQDKKKAYQVQSMSVFFCFLLVQWHSLLWILYHQARHSIRSITLKFHIACEKKKVRTGGHTILWFFQLALH